nr:DNA alkylation repair protein [candidate division Zixibacteria bacterium]
MIIKKIREEIKKLERPENMIDAQQFSKEALTNRYVLKAAVIRKASNRLFGEIKNQSKNDILGICDEILESDLRYRRFFAFEWAGKLHEVYSVSDFARFERWLKKYVDNWGTCDHIGIGILGPMVLRFPELTVRIKKWTSSKNRWVRRASAVALIIPVRNGCLLEDVFLTADILLEDQDDMVQKGYGWMLKESCKAFQGEVFSYVMKNKKYMPRTSLRYAIEKMPRNLKQQAMKKDW